MQGYILNYNNTKEEDLIVTILTKNKVWTLYRFYGARHSVINIGYKLDFEIEISSKVSINRLKDTIHLGFDWLKNNNKLYYWQEFIKLLYKHLKDISDIDSFYFELLDSIVGKLSFEAPKRAIIEGYIKLLEYEGRLDNSFTCLICENQINDKELVLVRSYALAHTYCIGKNKFNKHKLNTVFKNKNLFDLSDIEVDYLWYVLLEGP
jgi:recombinational DNA repair protein (RecF pathway)